MTVGSLLVEAESGILTPVPSGFVCVNEYERASSDWLRFRFFLGLNE